MVSVLLEKWHSRIVLAISLHPVFLCIISVSNENAFEEKFCIGRKFKKISKTRKNTSGHWKIQCVLRHSSFTHNIVTRSETPTENK